MSSNYSEKQVGKNTRIGEFVTLSPAAKIGGQCHIFPHCYIESDVEICERVTVCAGARLCDGVRIENDVFIGPNVCFTNDRFPRSGANPSEGDCKTVVKQGASIGANSTLLPGITIGAQAMIGAGSVVTSSVPPGAVVVGNPATMVRYVDAIGDRNSSTLISEDKKTPAVNGVRWLDLTTIRDLRGQLTIAEWDQDLPYRPERVFFVHHVPNAKIRGGHAHRECQQILVALSGSAKVVVDDSCVRQEFSLNDSRNALLVPAGVWATQYEYSADCVLAVFASHGYDENDYIRDYDQFLEYKK